MLIGFGCTVPAVMATRTLASERDRRMTILLTPFMSCSAKIPIYAMFCAAFFAKHQALAMIGLYLFGILLGIIVALILNKTAFRGDPVPLMQLPSYRMPSARNVLCFLGMARLYACLSIICLPPSPYGLQTFDIRKCRGCSHSLLAAFGQLLADRLI